MSLLGHDLAPLTSYNYDTRGDHQTPAHDTSNKSKNVNWPDRRSEQAIVSDQTPKNEIRLPLPIHHHIPQIDQIAERNYDTKTKTQIVIDWWNLHRDALLNFQIKPDLHPDQKITALRQNLETRLCPWAAQHQDPVVATLTITMMRLGFSNYIADTIWDYYESQILEAYLRSMSLEDGQHLWRQLLDHKYAICEETCGGYVAEALRSLIQTRVEIYQNRQSELTIYLRLKSSPSKPLTPIPSSLTSSINPVISVLNAPTQVPTNQADDSLLRLADEIYSEHWVRPIDFHHCQTLLIQAGLGRGKSLASRLFIQAHQTPRVIVISPRQTYAANIHGEFNREAQIEINGVMIPLQNLRFVNYLDHMQSPHWGRHPRLIISPESLHRLFTDYQPYDLVVGDEIESVLKQFSSQTTMTHNTAMCAYMFTQILKDAKNVVLLDAFLGRRSYKITKSLRVDVRIEINAHPPIQRKYRQYADSNRLFEVFFELLQQGWKIYFYCASKKKALELRFRLEQDSVDKKGLIYTSETSGADRRALKGVRELWGDPQLAYVITTSTNTVGINFDVGPNDPQGLRPFDLAFAYFSANGPVPRDGFQNLMRPRHLTQNFLHLYINDQYRGAKDYGATPDAVQSRIQRRESVIDRMVEQLKLDMRWDDVADWYPDLHIANLVEDGQSHRFQSSMVHRYLKICGYTRDDEGDDEQECEDRLEDVPPAPYESIPEIDDSRARILRDLVKTGEIPKEELQMLDKYFFHKKFDPQAPRARLKDLYRSHWQELSGKKHLSNLYDEKNYTPEQILQRDAKRCSRIKSRCQIKAEQRRLIGILNPILGISDSSAKAEISYDLLISITPQILDLRPEVQKAFETRGSSKPDRLNLNTQAAHLVNEVYRAWCNNGFKKILKSNGQPSKKKIKGVTTDISSYHLIGVMESGVLEQHRLWNLIRKIPSSDWLNKTLRNLIQESNATEMSNL